MLRKKSVVHRSHVAAVVIAPLAFALSMGVSHQAMADCVASGTAGVILDCSGDSEIDTAINNLNATSNANSVVQLLGAAGGSLEITENGSLTGSVAIGALNQNGRDIFGVNLNVGGSTWEIENEGSVTVSNPGTGQAIAMRFNNAESVTFTNEEGATVTANRAASSWTLGTNTAASLTASAAFGPSNVEIVAGVLFGEDVEEGVVNNEEGATIKATGPLAAGIFSRNGGSVVINNEGTIEYASTAAGGGGVAISHNNAGEWEEEPDDTASLTQGVITVNNAGDIKGDIQVVDAAEGTAIRYMAARLPGAGYDPQLIEGHRSDSIINNGGDIDGNIYLGSGNHVINNAAGGEIEGDISVDMRRNYDYTTVPAGLSAFPKQWVYVVGSSGEEEEEDEGEEAEGEVFTNLNDFLEAHPDHSFSFENAGTYKGNITVVTGTNTTGGRYTVEIAPHIFGPGGTFATPSENSGFIDGRLAIGAGSFDTASGKYVVTDAQSTVGQSGPGGADVSVRPVIDYLVKTGDWYLVAREFAGTDLPEIDSESVLVTWEIDKSGNALVIGSTVANASIVSGLSAPGVETLNALMQGGNAATNALGGAIQSLTSAEDVRKAGEQLAPETNFATQQAAWTLSMMTGNYIDNRLNGVGATSSPSSAFPAPSGLGMGQTASISQAPEGRMSLGFGTNDGRMNIGANDGRMDAGIYDKDPDLRQRGYSAALWGQAFGADLSQDQLANVDGYRTHIYGGIVGADNMIDARTRVGIAGGYGNTSINGDDDTKRNETEIDSYLGLLYGAYKGNGWYLSTRGGYAWHDYTTTRFVTVPTTIAANGSHSGNQYMASAEVGSPLHYYGATLTPVASLNWNRLEQDGYQESSVVGLNIASQENDSLQSGLGAKALIPIASDTLIEGRAVWYHEFEDTNQQVTAAFGGGANFTAAGPNVGRDTAAVGVGMFAYTEAGVSVQLNYDALLRQDFIGHTGSGRVKVEF